MYCVLCIYSISQKLSDPHDVKTHTPIDKYTLRHMATNNKTFLHYIIINQHWFSFEFTFKMQTRLRSRKQFHQLIRPISCNVRFEGSSVIEGIKNLGSQSFVDIPLPSYMTNLHSLSRNSFVLKEKENA